MTDESACELIVADVATDFMESRGYVALPGLFRANGIECRLYEVIGRDVRHLGEELREAGYKYIVSEKF